MGQYPGYQLTKEDYAKLEVMGSLLIVRNDLLAAEIGVTPGYFISQKQTDPEIKAAVLRGVLKVTKSTHASLISKALDKNKPDIELLKLLLKKSESLLGDQFIEDEREVVADNGQPVRAIATSRPIIAQIPQKTGEK